MKQYLLLIFLFMVFMPIGLCQKKPYTYIYESIDSIVLNHGYEAGKNRLQDYQKHYTVDPREISEFIKHSLDAEDISFYKQQIRFLSRNYGYILVDKDTIDIEWMHSSSLTKKIYKHDLVDWTIKTSTKGYRKWVAEHPHEVMLNERLYSMDQKDQYTRQMIAWSCTSDSIAHQQALRFWDYENFLELLTIYQYNDSIIPNPFDNGLKKPMGWLIIWHNLKTPENRELVWTLLLPYVEKTYFTGKIGKHFFEVYDHCLYTSQGEQYYGTIEGVPIRDAEHYEERKLKYKL